MKIDVIDKFTLENLKNYVKKEKTIIDANKKKK